MFSAVSQSVALQGHVVLTDFGLCKEGMNGRETTSTFCGTPEVRISTSPLVVPGVVPTGTCVYLVVVPTGTWCVPGCSTCCVTGCSTYRYLLCPVLVPVVSCCSTYRYLLCPVVVPTGTCCVLL